MALVAYDYSDSSDLDDEDIGNVKNVGIKDTKEIIILSVSDKASENKPSNGEFQELNLFESLPKPTLKILCTEEDDEFLHKKELPLKAKAKITIPSPAEFQDIADSPANVKKNSNPNGKGSSLLSILPEPKFSGSSSKKVAKPLIPNSVGRKIINIAPNPPPKLPKGHSSLKSNEQLKKSSLFANSDSDDDNDQNSSYVENDFFSFHKHHALAPDETVTEPIREEPELPDPSEVLQQNLKNTNNLNEAQIESHNIQELNELHEPSSSNDLQLDDEAIRKLCGSRSRHNKEDIKIITVDQKQVLSDSREWLVKGLMDDTSKRVSSSKRKGHEPTNQQKRKHQITYLAHQAKANEAELQNQWANNRMSKRQTQSKYGF